MISTKSKIAVDRQYAFHLSQQANEQTEVTAGKNREICGTRTRQAPDEINLA